MTVFELVVSDLGQFIAMTPALAAAPIIGAWIGMAVASFARDIGYQ